MQDVNCNKPPKPEYDATKLVDAANRSNIEDGEAHDDRHCDEHRLQKLIDVTDRVNSACGGSRAYPVTDEETDSLWQRAVRKGLGVDAVFVTFLRYANGIGFNGLTIPSASHSGDLHIVADLLIA